MTARSWAQDEEWSWDPDEVKLLKELYPRRDLTFKQICDYLNRSRGSVSGKPRRLGLKRSDKRKGQYNNLIF